MEGRHAPRRLAHLRNGRGIRRSRCSPPVRASRRTGGRGRPASDSERATPAAPWVAGVASGATEAKRSRISAVTRRMAWVNGVSPARLMRLRRPAERAKPLTRPNRPAAVSATVSIASAAGGPDTAAIGGNPTVRPFADPGGRGALVGVMTQFPHGGDEENKCQPEGHVPPGRGPYRAASGVRDRGGELQRPGGRSLPGGPPD